MKNRALQYSIKEFEAAMRPTKLENGKWRKADISKRCLADIRKYALKSNTYGEWIPGQGGWLKEWDQPKKHIVMKPLKMGKNERRLQERVEKVQKALENQPKVLEAHKKATKDAKQLTGIKKWISEAMSRA